MPKNIMDDSGADFKVDAATDVVPVTKDDDNDLPDGPCRGLLIGTGGTANLTMLDGTERDEVPLQTGYNLIVCRAVRAGGDADDIWALY